MTAAGTSHRLTRLGTVALLAVAVLVGGTAVATASPSSPSPSPSPSATSTPSPAPNRPATGTARAAKPVVCAKGANGRLVDCPKPLPVSKRPPGARNTQTVTSPVTDPATLVDARTWTSGGGNTFPGAIVPFGM